MIFKCGTRNDTGTVQEVDALLSNEDLCEAGMDGSGYHHLAIPGTPATYLEYQLSPDGKTLAYIRDGDPAIYIYNLETHQIVTKIPYPPKMQYLNFMLWVSVDAVQSLSHLPTLTPPPPTVTPSMKLSLKAVCLPAGRNSTNQDVWRWEIVNPNLVALNVAIDYYDFQRKSIISDSQILVQPATNGVPSVSFPIYFTQPSPYKVHLYLDGVLQDEESVSPIPCPGATKIPTYFPAPTVTPFVAR